MKLSFKKANLSALPLDLLMSVIIWALIAVIAFACGIIFEQSRVIAQEQEESESFDMALVMKTREYMKNNYYKPLDDFDDEMLYGAMRGIVDVVHSEPFNDPYSGFFDPERYKSLETETTGEYAGIGVLIEVTTESAYPHVMKVFRDSPAANAGLSKDDFITAVDGVSTENRTLAEVGDMIMGERGTLVKLTITDNLSLEPRYVDVKRDTIVIHSVEEARMLGAGVGYIMLSSFQDNTTIEMIDALKNLSSLGMRKLILDLRSNGGGVLENAVDVASMFIPDGETVTTLVYKNKDPEVRKADATQTRGKFPKYDIPIVVLVDGRSASASEVLSGALRDHGKAVLVGEKTFGKGEVQQIYEISNKYRKLALVITVATYFTPGGRDIDADGGIVPDVNIGFDQYREAIPRLSQIETEIDRLRSEMIGYRDEIVDSMLENDIVLESVRGNFDATFDKGMKSRESRDKTDSSDDDPEDTIDNATPGNVESGDGDKPVVDGKGADESQPLDENPIGSIRDNRNSIRC